VKKVALLLILSFNISTVIGQLGKDNFYISWPTEYSWKKYDLNTHIELPSPNEDSFRYWSLGSDKVIGGFELIPKNETLNNWTIKGTMLRRVTYDRKAIYSDANINLVAKGIFAVEKKTSPNAKFVVLDQISEREVLFKIENLQYKDTPSPQSKLYYILLGTHPYIASVAIKESHLSNDFTAKWTKIFKSRNYSFY